MRWLRQVNYGPLFLAVIGFLFGVLGRFVGNPNAPSLRWLPWIIGALLVFVGLYVLERWHPARTTIDIGSATPLRNDAEKERYARRGIIAFVSLYTPPRGTTLTPAEIQEALNSFNFEALNLERSNLAPTIHAVLTHKSQLRHCWLIGTTDSPSGTAGSARYISILVHYLHNRYNLDCQFHFGPQYEVSLDDDGAVCGKANHLVRTIVSEAQGANLHAKDMLVDITSGIRSLPTGAMMAALEAGIDVQFMGTRYDENGHFIPEVLFPVVVPVELKVPKS